MSVLLMVLIAAPICFADQPKLVTSAIEPDSVAAGQFVKISVEFSGTKEDLTEVYLTVREYPEDFPKIPLHTAEGEEKSLWAEEGEVPWDAPMGTVHLDINALDKDGKEVVSEGFEDNDTGRAGTIELNIK